MYSMKLIERLFFFSQKQNSIYFFWKSPAPPTLHNKLQGQLYIYDQNVYSSFAV